ncbi:hypothetical protein KR222_003966 [Zaprionus bogoriensis]|nr:hypothetical protein KR222_003966 [Zaprionus bogoriensis]
MDIFENICRTCGNDCLDANNIFVDSAPVLEKRLPITDILSACLPAGAALAAPTPGDDYPKQICRVCVKKLSMICEFNHKWLTAHNEFNVALKFEQRRNRSRASTATAAAAATAAEPNIVFKHEPNDVAEMEDDDVLDEPELGHNLQATHEGLAIAPSMVNYQCALCEEKYHTLAAYQKHHKVSHRSCQPLYYTPGQ